MEPIRDPEIMARMEAAFDLYDFSDEIMRQNLRRRNPGASEQEIQRLFVEWLHGQPLEAHLPPESSP